MSFSLKGAFTKVADGFATAWTDVKSGAATAVSFITAQKSAITADTAEIGADVEAAFPGATGVVNVIETLESKVMGIVLAGASEIENANPANATQTITALKGLLPQITALQSQLSTHPAVTAANTAPAAASTAS